MCVHEPVFVRFDRVSRCPHLTLSVTKESCQTVSHTVRAPAATEDRQLLRRVAQALQARIAKRRLAPSPTRLYQTGRPASRSDSDKCSDLRLCFHVCALKLKVCVVICTHYIRMSNVSQHCLQMVNASETHAIDQEDVDATTSA